MLDGVADVVVIDAMTASRAVNLHTTIMYYINTLADNQRGGAPVQSGTGQLPGIR